MRFAGLFFVLGVVFALFFESAEAKKHAVYLDDASVVARSYPDSGGYYYTVELEVPDEIKGKELYGAFLEFYVDVTGAARDSASVRIPILEIYALTSSYGGQIDPTKFDRLTGSARNTPPGDDQRMLVDITGIVKKYIQNKSTNHGLIIGGLEGVRNGSFTWKRDWFQSSKPAKITFHYDNRRK